MDNSLALALIVQCGLGLGSLVELGKDRDDLSDLAQRIESCETFASFAVTELGYGNSHLSPTTCARFDPETRSFTLHTPDPAAQKFMANVGAPHASRVAVVMARLFVGDEDRGAHQFIVPLTTPQAGTCPGVTLRCLPHTPVVPLDYGLLALDHVHLPYTAWLHDGAGFDANGRYHDWVPHPQARLTRSLSPARNVWAGFPSALASASRALAQLLPHGEFPRGSPCR